MGSRLGKPKAEGLCQYNEAEAHGQEATPQHVMLNGHVRVLIFVSTDALRGPL